MDSVRMALLGRQLWTTVIAIVSLVTLEITKFGLRQNLVSIRWKLGVRAVVVVTMTPMFTRVVVAATLKA